MNRQKPNWIIIGLGGSIVRPDDLNTRLLNNFYKFLLPFLEDGYRFVVVVGGGRLAREYQEAALKIAPKTPQEELDWLGIQATRINAYILKAIFHKKAYPYVIDDPERHWKIGDHQLVFASGSKPGWSTDYIAARLAQKFGVSEFILAGRPAYVYDKDNLKFKSARPIPILSWKDYMKICGDKWSPGMRAPVDPVASRFAQKNRMTAIVLNGADFKNFGKAICGEPFHGSVINN